MEIEVIHRDEGQIVKFLPFQDEKPETETTHYWGNRRCILRQEKFKKIAGRWIKSKTQEILMIVGSTNAFF